jgi:hypothetical protein
MKCRLFQRADYFEHLAMLVSLKLSAACGDGLSISSSTSCRVTSGNLDGGPFHFYLESSNMGVYSAVSVLHAQLLRRRGNKASVHGKR